VCEQKFFDFSFVRLFLRPFFIVILFLVILIPCHFDWSGSGMEKSLPKGQRQDSVVKERKKISD
jgi:hypothetical protein